MDIIICGVGGQGTVLASRVLGDAAIRKGYQVRTSEIIGMAQREGSVLSEVRMAAELQGPLVPDAGADFLLGFELAEATRYAHKIKPGSQVLINQQTIIPPAVFLGASVYPAEEMLAFWKSLVSGVVFIDAVHLAQQAGERRTVSAVMLGAFTAMNQELEPDLVREELLTRFSGEKKDYNARAFDLGREYVEGLSR